MRWRSLFVMVENPRGTAPRYHCAMPAYSYQALDANGKSRSGVLEADTAKSARGLLRTQGLVPLQVQTLSAEGVRSEPSAGIWGKRAFTTNQRAVWTRQLAGLVSAGLPLERALSSLADEAETPAQRDVVATIRAEVNGGKALGVALAQHPREFSDIFIAVVSAGEQSGQLGLVLERLADDLEEQQNLSSKLLGAALYPAIVSIVALVIVLFLLAYVVPQIANVFAGSKQALPLLTRIMLTLSDAVRTYGWLVLIAIISGAIFTRYAWTKPAFRSKADALWLRLPVLGRMSRGYNAARFASTLAMLAAAGVPILKALQAAAETLSNHAMRDDALEALTLVREGAPLASALARNQRFPALLSMFARLGEQTGKLPHMLDRAAVQLRTEVQRRALQLATLLEPLLIVAMGLVVMLIVLAVLMPIIQLNQLVR
jgi:general secretion pathway protein F